MRKLVSAHQLDASYRLPTFLLAHVTSIHEAIRLAPASVVFVCDLRLLRDLRFAATPDGKPSAIYNSGAT